MTYTELVDKLIAALRKSGDVAPMYRALMCYFYQGILNRAQWNLAVKATREAQSRVWGEK